MTSSAVRWQWSEYLLRSIHRFQSTEILLFNVWLRFFSYQCRFLRMHSVFDLCTKNADCLSDMIQKNKSHIKIQTFIDLNTQVFSPSKASSFFQDKQTNKKRVKISSSHLSWKVFLLCTTAMIHKDLTFVILHLKGTGCPSSSNLTTLQECQFVPKKKKHHRNGCTNFNLPIFFK